MTCNIICHELQAYHDCELSWLRSVQARRHLKACAECRAQLEQIERLYSTLRNADIVGRGALVASPNPRVHPLVNRRRPALISAAVAVAALLTLTLALPLAHPRKTLAAEVGAAVGSANTWRMSGWRLMGGRHVPWDIWGRRAPFLYYEKVGDDTFYDDGKVQTRSYAPTAARPRGVRIQCASNGSQFYGMNEEPTWSSLVDSKIWSAGSNAMFLTKFREDKKTTAFRRQYSLFMIPGVNANEVLTVDRDTNLPVQYQLHYNRLKQGWDTEFLTLTYNLKIPQNVQSPVWAAGDREIDLRPTTITATRGASAASKIGLVLQGVPRAIDPEGTIYLSLATNLHGRNIDTSTEGPLYTAAAPVEQEQERPLFVDCIDRRGRKSRVLYLNENENVSPLGDVALICPLSPLPQGTRPAHVRLPIRCTVSFDAPATDVIDAEGHVLFSGTRPIEVANDQVVISVDLGQKNIGATLTPYLSKLIGPYSSRTLVALTRQLCDVRAEYWWAKEPAEGIVSADSPIVLRHGQWVQPVYEAHKKEIETIKLKNIQRGVYWLKRCRETYADHGDERYRRLDKTNQIAEWYHQIGRNDLARPFWKQVVQECLKTPYSDDRRRKAEAGLEGGKSPKD